ncbi:MAG: CPBP family intramembrane metalloprotease [Balneolaceae bacterium]|nr:CPBP family intramembrane metalloprotease [Balneolaceae bacterium]MBO6545065.1 CPBP family intramembrane metalloprotease [Balneolaceae bacterium]MBO6646461.1 CPBP family intramembrane metalloprotease [Balneolaceae bacterium]
MGVGLILALLAFAIPLITKTLIYNIEWSFSDSANFTDTIKAFYFYFNSVLFEELLFRGALLSLIIYFTSSRTAILISATAFGIYHWFSYGMFGNGLVPMAYIFLLTGGMGLIWAYMYSKTNSIVLPVVAHLGWNFQSALFLDYQPFGQLLFKSTINRELPELADFGIQAGGDILSILLMLGGFKYYQHKKRKPVINQLS